MKNLQEIETIKQKFESDLKDNNLKIIIKLPSNTRDPLDNQISVATRFFLDDGNDFYGISMNVENETDILKEIETQLKSVKHYIDEFNKTGEKPTTDKSLIKVL